MVKMIELIEIEGFTFDNFFLEIFSKALYQGKFRVPAETHEKGLFPLDVNLLSASPKCKLLKEIKINVRLSR